MQTNEQYVSGNVAESSLTSRLEFLRRTYLHLLGAAVVFVILSWALFQMGVGVRIVEMVGAGRMGWLLFLGGFMVVTWMATGLASQGNDAMSYAGFGLYIIAEALIFSPLIAIAAIQYPGVLPQAVLLTLVGFGTLSVYVLTTKKDFSFLGPALAIAGVLALGAIVVGVLFNLSLGTWFSALMILFACGAILYTTSKVLYKYRTDQVVPAALELFAAVALLFWYILRILMGSRR